MPLGVRERDQLSSSLVADPLGTENWIANPRTEPGSNARPDAVRLAHAWMEGSTTRLQSELVARDPNDENQYTLWIIAGLAGMVGISVVAGLAFMSTVTAIFSGYLPFTVMGMISPPLYVALFVALAGAFVAILFVVHRAREPKSPHPGIGFAGFAWNTEGGSERYLGTAGRRPLDALGRLT